jgi:hypothetical protein
MESRKPSNSALRRESKCGEPPRSGSSPSARGLELETADELVIHAPGIDVPCAGAIVRAADANQHSQQRIGLALRSPSKRKPPATTSRAPGGLAWTRTIPRKTLPQTAGEEKSKMGAVPKDSRLRENGGRSGASFVREDHRSCAWVRRSKGEYSKLKPGTSNWVRKPLARYHWGGNTSQISGLRQRHP